MGVGRRRRRVRVMAMASTAGTAATDRHAGADVSWLTTATARPSVFTDTAAAIASRGSVGRIATANSATLIAASATDAKSSGDCWSLGGPSVKNRVAGT